MFLLLHLLELHMLFPAHLPANKKLKSAKPEPLKKFVITVYYQKPQIYNEVDLRQSTPITSSDRLNFIWFSQHLWSIFVMLLCLKPEYVTDKELAF